MIILENIQKVYNAGKSNEFTALDSINLKIADGELLAIVGKSGAGKSTLLHIIAGIESYEKGRYLLDDCDIGSCKDQQIAKIRSEKIGIVLQNYSLLEKESVLDNVILPAYFSPVSIKAAKKHALEILEKVGMKECSTKPVNELSGGQKQRVAIARALLNNPDYLLADEPTGALDEKNGKDIMNLFSKINQEGTTVIIITHDKEIAGLCKRSVEIKDGQLV